MRGAAGTNLESISPLINGSPRVLDRISGVKQSVMELQIGVSAVKQDAEKWFGSMFG
jgi:hypothetical protein